MQKLLKIDFFCTGVKLIKPVNKKGSLSHYLQNVGCGRLLFIML